MMIRLRRDGGRIFGGGANGRQFRKEVRFEEGPKKPKISHKKG